jgi:hypothetical protein
MFLPVLFPTQMTIHCQVISALIPLNNTNNNNNKERRIKTFLKYTRDSLTPALCEITLIIEKRKKKTCGCIMSLVHYFASIFSFKNLQKKK